MEEITMVWGPTMSSLEPLRPLSPELFDEPDFKVLADLDFKNVAKLTRSEVAGKLLDHLDGLKTEEPEPFDWFTTEKTIDLPLFENVPSPSQYRIFNNVKPTIHNHAFAENPKYESHLLQDYNTFDAAQPISVVIGASFDAGTGVEVGSPYASAHSPSGSSGQISPVPLSPSLHSEWLKAETLTPPDSPKDEEILKLLQEFEPGELEQLVMSKVEEFPDAAILDDSSCSEYSDGGASPSVGSDSGMEDPEWSPPRRMKSSSASGYASSSSYCNSSKAAATKRKSKPYARPALEERKLRKKEQNKNAATRYRMKKKAEVEEIKSEEKVLEDRNKELHAKFEDLHREVKYLKSLMRDVYRKKGLIK